VILVHDVASIAECYPELVAACCNGDRTVPRGKECYEVRPVILRTSSHGRLANAGVNYKLATAEAMAYLVGWHDVAWLERFRPGFHQFSDDGSTFFGAYGRRIRDGLGDVINRLIVDGMSRQAVLSIWGDKDTYTPSKDLPCNTQLLFKLRDGYLDLSVVVRSQDVVWGLPYDHDAWWLFLEVVSKLLNAVPGYLTQFIDSLHVYHPSAGFYDQERIQKARQATPTVVKTPWQFSSNSLSGVRAELESVRLKVEKGISGLDPLADFLIGGTP
jgi:hypothetical protein